MSRPRGDDPSVPRQSEYAYKKRFYRRPEVAEDYDAHRLGTPLRRWRYRRRWSLVRRILNDLEGVETILDLPCGTGRDTGPLADAGYRVVGADISMEMMRRARQKKDASPGGPLGYVQADAERLPFEDDAVDCVLSMRFTFHLDDEVRVRVLREMKRVSNRWVLIDYRHRYTWRWLKRWVARKLGLDDRPFQRMSRKGLRREFRESGLRLDRVVRGGMVGFSDKWLVVGEVDEPASPDSILSGTELEGVEVLGRLGEGARSVVYAARWRGREAVLKVYKPQAVAAHDRRHPLPIAEFEHDRNARFHAAPGMAPFVAEPLGRVVNERGQAFLQERIEGPTFAELRRAGGGHEEAAVFEKMEEVVDRAHRAGLYEVDVHPGNVKVVATEDGAARPVFFDFNLLPLHERAWNPIRVLARLGLLDRGRRDRRHLRKFRE